MDQMNESLQPEKNEAENSQNAKNSNWVTACVTSASDFLCCNKDILTASPQAKGGAALEEHMQIVSQRNITPWKHVFLIAFLLYFPTFPSQPSFLPSPLPHNHPSFLSSPLTSFILQFSLQVEHQAGLSML